MALYNFLEISMLLLPHKTKCLDNVIFECDNLQWLQKINPHESKIITSLSFRFVEKKLLFSYKYILPGGDLNGIHALVPYAPVLESKFNFPLLDKAFKKYIQMFYVQDATKKKDVKDFSGKFKKKQFIEELSKYYDDVNEDNVVEKMKDFFYSLNEFYTEDELVLASFCKATFIDNNIEF